MFPVPVLQMLKNDSLGTNRADFGLKSKFWDFVPPILMSWRRLEMWQEKNEMARLMPELRTSPLRFAQQMRSTNLLSRMEGHQIDSGGSYVEALAEGEVESSVFLSNLTKTFLLPQLTKSPTKIMTPQQLTSPTTCQSCSQRMQQNVKLYMFVHLSEQ